MVALAGNLRQVVDAGCVCGSDTDRAGQTRPRGAGRAPRRRLCLLRCDRLFHADNDVYRPPRPPLYLLAARTFCILSQGQWQTNEVQFGVLEPASYEFAVVGESPIILFTGYDGFRRTPERRPAQTN